MATFLGNITEFHLNSSLSHPIVLIAMVSLLWDALETILVYMSIAISLNEEAILIVEVMPGIAIFTTIPDL